MGVHRAIHAVARDRVAGLGVMTLGLLVLGVLAEVTPAQQRGASGNGRGMSRVGTDRSFSRVGSNRGFSRIGNRTGFGNLGTNRGFSRIGSNRGFSRQSNRPLAPLGGLETGRRDTGQQAATGNRPFQPVGRLPDRPGSLRYLPDVSYDPDHRGDGNRREVLRPEDDRRGRRRGRRQAYPEAGFERRLAPLPPADLSWLPPAPTIRTEAVRGEARRALGRGDYALLLDLLDQEQATRGLVDAEAFELRLAAHLALGHYPEAARAGREVLARNEDAPQPGRFAARWPSHQELEARWRDLRHHLAAAPTDVSGRFLDAYLHWALGHRDAAARGVHVLRQIDVLAPGLSLLEQRLSGNPRSGS